MYKKSFSDGPKKPYTGGGNSSGYKGKPSSGGYRGGSSTGGSFRSASPTRYTSAPGTTGSAGTFRTSPTPSRGGFGGGRGGFSGGSRGGGRSSGGGRGRSFKGNHIDVSKFINKAVVTEIVETFVPEHAFTDFLIDESLKNTIVKKGYKTPTPIQDRAIPYLLKGLDIVGIANTGTGKTAAFLIPLIDKVIKDPEQRILIVVPTRELATQIQDELRGFTQGMKIFSVCCVGGASISFQMKELKYKNNFVIGTPGRIKDLMERKCLDLGLFKTVVLDEADRMLDMGFINDMRFMMDRMPKDRHTLFFSATMSREIEVLIKDFLKNPMTISVKTGDTSKNVDQDIVRIEKGKAKTDILHELLIQKDFAKVLIFGKTKHGVEKLYNILLDRGIKVESIHGDKNHGKRQKALSLFKDDKIQVLVATDVAARGIDVSGVTHVINYDLPATYEDYVHRIGRTGRAGKKGKALTFIE